MFPPKYGGFHFILNAFGYNCVYGTFGILEQKFKFDILCYYNILIFALWCMYGSRVRVLRHVLQNIAKQSFICRYNTNIC